MKNKSLRLMVLGMVVVLALLVFVPTASASMVTKIMLAQENVEVYEWTAPSNGQLWVKVDWLDHNGVASSYPVSEVDAGIIGPSGQGNYVDFDVKSLYSGVNGNTGTQTVSSGKTYYIAVFPWFDDCTATVTMKLGGSGGTNITATRLSDGATVTSPQTVAATGANGEVYLPSTGDWISTFQYWPGTASEYYACWNDYVYERIAGSTYDTLAEAYAMIWYQTASGLQAPTRATLTAPGAPQGPHAQKWYAIGPQIWPAATVPNLVDGLGNVKPGAVAATKAPAWYTYAYEDASVTTQTPAYFWNTLTMAAASKRNFSNEVATGASFGASFSGTSITWVYPKSTASGIARVTIDSVDKGTVDQYGAFVNKAQTTFGGLADTNHTIVITNTATKNAASSNTFVSHDAFLAKGVGDASDPTPYLENNYDGQTWYKWGTLSFPGQALGGSFSNSVATGAAIACEFSGTSVQWVYETNLASGKAFVYIDGVLKDTVDQYSPGLVFQASKTYGGLANTTHIIMIANSGTKNAAANNTFINHDAFVVGGTTIQN